MEFIYKKSFKKEYKKLSYLNKKKVNDVLFEFRKDPHNPNLKNHALTGSMKGLRSMSAGFDLRILFREFENYTVIYLMEVGTHTQVYGD